MTSLDRSTPMPDSFPVPTPHPCDVFVTIVVALFLQTMSIFIALGTPSSKWISAAQTQDESLRAISLFFPSAIGWAVTLTAKAVTSIVLGVALLPMPAIGLFALYGMIWNARSK